MTKWVGSEVPSGLSVITLDNDHTDERRKGVIPPRLTRPTLLMTVQAECTHCRSSNTPVRLTEVGGISPFWKRFRALIGRLLKNLQVLQECNASERSGPSGPPFGPEDRIRATRNECNDMFGKNR